MSRDSRIRSLLEGTFPLSMPSALAGAKDLDRLADERNGRAAHPNHIE
jgi:hypothetical protein